MGCINQLSTHGYFGGKKNKKNQILRIEQISKNQYQRQKDGILCSNRKSSNSLNPNYFRFLDLVR